MYLAYARAIQDLGQDFHLVLMARAGRIDATAAGLFDEVEALEGDQLRIPDLVDRIGRIAPDLIYYPSLGLDTWTLLLANLRLAPIQFMTPGHPASSFAETMDYFVAAETTLADDPPVSEIAVARRTRGATRTRVNDAEDIKPIIRERPDPVRVAVPGKSVKLNATLIRVCQSVQRASQRRVEFLFFPAEEGIRLEKIRRRLATMLDNVTVYPRAAYNQYVRWLNEADLALGTFPFGSSTTDVEVFGQCIPKVALLGDEPHARTDLAAMRAFDMPAWLLTDTEEAYREAAALLVNDDATRVAIARHIQQKDPATVFFGGPGERNGETDLGNVVRWIHRHHERIQASGRRCFGPDDRSTVITE